MNRAVLRYQLDGRDIYYEEKSGGFVVYAESLSPPLVREIGTCGGEISISTAGEPAVFLVREVADE